MKKCISIVFLLFLSHLCYAQKQAWPTVLKGSNLAKVTKVETDTDFLVCRGKFFHYRSDSNIPTNEMRKFAATSESVYYALKKIPLDLVHPPKFNPDSNTHSIFIYENINAYDAAVGVKHSAGYYSKSKRSVYLRKDKFITSDKPNFQLLVHELTHLNMHGIIRYSNAWFSEGNAEYMASSFFGTGSYNFNTITTGIRKRAQSFIRTEGEAILLPALESLVTLDDPRWITHSANIAPEDRYRPYLAALILVHHFYHTDPSGREKISRYIADLTNQEESRKLRSARRANAQRELFKKTDFSELQKNLELYWKKKGLRISFQES